MRNIARIGGTVSRPQPGRLLAARPLRAWRHQEIPPDVVKITAYVASLDDYGRYNEVRREVFGANLPTSTAVAVAGLIVPGASIEIDAVAFVPKAGG